ncbi:MAG: formylglycine-generating enzyme family protein [Candidatus Aquilonibacter sp.]
MARTTITTDQVPIEGGEFTMGSVDFYPEERPFRRMHVESFSIDRYPVTNAEFARFVDESAYVTVAERAIDPAQYPGAIPELCVPGSLVFRPTRGPVDLNDWSQWWEWTPGALWRRPLGPDSSLDGLEDHPVVHVAFEDAQAYADWANKSLPTEAEWEYAARGGLEQKHFTWGDEIAPGGKIMANTWQGEFPWQNLELDGFARTSPVGAFPPNAYGLYDMAGNVWEWTTDWYTTLPGTIRSKPCCGGGSVEESYDPNQPNIRIPRKVVKGGSHLCAPNYCLRFRPAARSPQMIDTSMSHLGFRCITRLA